MSRTVDIVGDVYAIVGNMPWGCRFCLRGSKIVVFVTGLCDDKCFYCPVSPEKLYRDVIRVDEEPVQSLEDILDEVYAVGAEGAGITGGDPLVKVDRTVGIIRILKEIFGDDFHIHLYTSGRYASSVVLRALESVGLDEIRFHVIDNWVLQRIKLALEVLRDVDVGVEIPIFPDRIEETKRLIKKLDEMGVSFINLNELEASENNMRVLLMRGYKIVPGTLVVKGSREAAVEIVRWASKNTKKITVHFCPASYKDRVQMRIRLIRKALRTVKPYEKVAVDGMVVVLEVEPADQAKQLAREGYGEPEDDRILLHPDLHLPGAQVRRRYPARLATGLPLELQRIAENSDNAA